MTEKKGYGPTYQEAWGEFDRLTAMVGKPPTIKVFPPYTTKLGVRVGATVYVTVDRSATIPRPDGTDGATASFGHMGEYQTLSAALWNACVMLQNKLSSKAEQARQEAFF